MAARPDCNSQSPAGPGFSRGLMWSDRGLPMKLDHLAAGGRCRARLFRRVDILVAWLDGRSDSPIPGQPEDRRYDDIGCTLHELPDDIEVEANLGTQQRQDEERRDQNDHAVGFQRG